MGTYLHRTIAVTAAVQPVLQQLYQQVKEIFSDYPQLVTPLFATGGNGYRSFFVMPSGYKVQPAADFSEDYNRIQRLMDRVSGLCKDLEGIQFADVVYGKDLEGKARVMGGNHVAILDSTTDAPEE